MSDADWSVSFRYPADDPSQAEPLPEPHEVVAWLARIVAFRAEVTALIGESPG